MMNLFLECSLASDFPSRKFIKSGAPSRYYTKENILNFAAQEHLFPEDAQELLRGCGIDVDERELCTWLREQRDKQSHLSALSDAELLGELKRRLAANSREGV